MNATCCVQWNEISKIGSTTNGTEPFLRMRSPQTYHVRPVSSPCAFVRLYNEVDGKKLTAICTKDTQDRLPGYIEGGVRYAFFVIDRADNTIKIIEAPKSVVSPFGTYVQITGHSPHDPKQGSDFAIKVTGSGLMTRYFATSIAVTPLTDKEMAAVGATNLSQRLLAHYQIQSYEQVMQKLQLRGTVSGKTA